MYLVMEFLDGQNLQKLIETHGPLGYEEALPLADQVLAGLSAAHEAGVVHRDLKPENIFVRPDPGGHSLAHAEVKILDFGLAKEISPDEKSPVLRAAEGVPVGTPAFMSPEQCKGLSTIDARSDLYSVGVILYWLFTGKLPFDAPSYLDVIKMQISSVPRRPSELCDMPHALEEIDPEAPREEAGGSVPDGRSGAHGAQGVRRGADLDPRRRRARRGRLRRRRCSDRWWRSSPSTGRGTASRTPSRVRRRRASSG